jgi:alkylation response protein AidB-like acyl-CoA dehydrogenase
MSSLTADASLLSLLNAVHEIEPVILAHAADAERDRRLSDAVTSALRAVGLYRMWRPKALGGLEVEPMTAFQVIEGSRASIAQPAGTCNCRPRSMRLGRGFPMKAPQRFLVI